jgi:hypothetical protein
VAAPCARDAAPSSPLVAISLLSASTLAYEVLLMRLFSIIQWHHFAYMIISVALLGYGLGGALVAVAQDALKARYAIAFVIAAASFGITALASFLLAQRVAFDPLELLWDPEQPLRLLLICLLLVVPFACAATCICLTFARFSDQPHRIYSSTFWVRQREAWESWRVCSCLGRWPHCSLSPAWVWLPPRWPLSRAGCGQDGCPWPCWEPQWSCRSAFPPAGSSCCPPNIRT